MNRIRLKAPAKINLFLDISEQDSNGFHKIVTLFQAIDLFDELKIEKSGESEIDIIPDNIIIENNIINKVIKKISSGNGYRIRLYKNIPIGAGLGGGSSDAAATLIGIAALENHKYREEELTDILSSIGKDSPFFIQGGTQIGINYGETLESEDVDFEYYIILIYPGYEISTKKVYNSISSRDFRKGEKNLEKIITAIKEKNLDKLVNNLYNIFEIVIFKEYSDLLDIKEELIKNGADNALVSGTGSTVYGIFKERSKAVEVYNKLRRVYKKIYLVKPYYRGVTIV